MKIIFDNNIPVGLVAALSNHEVTTCPQLGWTRTRNGDLLTAAETAGFALMITGDQNWQYQQNLSKRAIAIIVLGSNRWSIVRQHLDEIAYHAEAAAPGSFVFIEMPEARRRRG